MASEHFDDYELGFVDAAIGAVKGVGKVFKKIGGAIKKRRNKKKKKKNKVIQMPAQDIVGTVPEDVIKSAAASVKARGEAVTPEGLSREVATSVPPIVREQVLAAIKDNKASNLSTAAALESVARQVDDAIKPQVAAMLGALQAQQLSNQATYEHRNIVERDTFRRETKENLQSIAKRLAEIDAGNRQIVASLKLGNVAIVRKNLPIFGPKNVLED